MDFFERYLHISPDAGSGASEALYVVAVTIFLFLFLNRRTLRYATLTCKRVTFYACRAHRRFGTKHL
jgi:hypothetical protein